MKRRQANAKIKGTNASQCMIIRFLNTSWTLIDFLDESGTFYEQARHEVKGGTAPPKSGHFIKQNTINEAFYVYTVWTSKIQLHSVQALNIINLALNEKQISSSFALFFVWALCSLSIHDPFCSAQFLRFFQQAITYKTTFEVKDCRQYWRFKGKGECWVGE